MDNHRLEVLNDKIILENFNSGKPSPAPPPSLPHMLAIAGAYPLEPVILNPFDFCPRYSLGDKIGATYAANTLSKSKMHLERCEDSEGVE